MWRGSGGASSRRCQVLRASRSAVASASGHTADNSALSAFQRAASAKSAPAGSKGSNSSKPAYSRTISVTPVVVWVMSSRASFCWVGFVQVSQRTASCEPRLGVPSMTKRLLGKAVMRCQAAVPAPPSAIIARTTRPPMECATRCTG